MGRPERRGNIPKFCRILPWDFQQCVHLNYTTSDRSLFHNSNCKMYLQIVCQVMFLQSMCFKAMWGCVKVVIADSTNKAFGLKAKVVVTDKF